MSQVSSQSEYEFRDVILSVPERGIEIDISLSILELILYESVNVPYLTGKILCADTQHIFEKLKMDGTERLRLNIISSEYEYSFQRNFIITRTIGKASIGESGFGYNFYITEDTFFTDVLTKVSRAYTGKPHDIIKSVLSSEFDKDLNLIGKESNQSPFTYIAPYISPFGIVETIRKRASDRNGYPFFVYASINDESIRMKSLSEIIENEPINTKPFTYSTAQNHNLDIQKQLTNVEFYQEVGHNDTAELIIKGAVQNQYNVLNLSTNQRNTNTRFNITEVLDAKDNSIFNTNLKINDKPLNEYDPNIVYDIANHTSLDELGYHDERDMANHINTMKANALVAALDKRKINIALAGVLNYIQGGKTVFVGEQILINKPDNSTASLDLVASGPYVVLEAKHAFIDNKYSMGLTCSKLTNQTDTTIAVGPSGYPSL